MLSPQSQTPWRPQQHDLDWLPDWALEPTESSLSKDVEDDLRIELQQAYNAAYRYHDFPRSLIVDWTYLSYMLAVSDKPQSLHPEQLRKLCNKEVCCYWTSHALEEPRCPPKYIWAAVWKEWFRCHNEQPPIEYDSFFGRAAHITSTGPKTIAGIVDAHAALWDQAQSLHRKWSNRNAYGRPSQAARNYKLLPLLGALILVFEELIPSEQLPRTPDGKLDLEKILQVQTVLLVRTGDESGLNNSPISFQHLEPATETTSILPSQALPTNNTTEIRVPLGTAIRFIAGLQRNEEGPARPTTRLVEDRTLYGLLDKYRDSDILSRVLDKEVFAEAYMRLAQRHGIDSFEETWKAIRRVKASRRNIEVDAVQVSYFYEFPRKCAGVGHGFYWEGRNLPRYGLDDKN